MTCGRVVGAAVAALLGAACGSVSNSADAPPGDDSASPDAPLESACGDGRRDPGEVCYGPPTTIVGSDVTYDGQLADQDGDGDLDLIYLIGDQYVFHPQNAGVFAATGLGGPTTLSRFFRVGRFDGDALNDLIDVGAGGQFSVWSANGAGGYTLLSSNSAGGVDATPIGMGVGNVTGGGTVNVLGLAPDGLRMATFDNGFAMTITAEASPPGASGLAVGRLDSDTFADVVIAGTNGVFAYRGQAGDLGQTITTPRTTATSGVAIGDVDADGIADLVYVAAGPNGQLGAMLGVGGAAYQNATTQTVTGLRSTVVTADIDGDGRADAIAGGPNKLFIARGLADGSLGAPTEIPLAAVVDDIHADADYNGDGAPDIVTTDVNNQTLLILPSNP